MKKPIPLLTAALLLFALVPLDFPRGVRGAAQKTTTKKKPAAVSTVVFAVEKYETRVTMEPVVVYSRGTFGKPPIDGDDKAINSFVGEYFKEGRQYRLLSGGGEAGTVTVKKYLEPGCVGLVAEASAQTRVRLGGEVRALATSSTTIGRQTTSRRPPTDTERALALEFARLAYVSNGVGDAHTNRMEVVNLTATDLDGDGKFELIGSFNIDRVKGQAADGYALFIIYEPQGELIKPALTWFHNGGEAEYEDRRLVDQLDVDGDGIAEVVAAGHYYESNDYIIYKKRQGRWREVYRGGGGGC
ncbi:MAG: VCBS repeat-containing protein [Rubrivivax sp.]|nr:VCBS repeat-containing protein [Pyrinomonadaceae bacterium]